MDDATENCQPDFRGPSEKRAKSNPTKKNSSKTDFGKGKEQFQFTETWSAEAQQNRAYDGSSPQNSIDRYTFSFQRDYNGNPVFYYGLSKFSQRARLQHGQRDLARTGLELKTKLNFTKMLFSPTQYDPKTDAHKFQLYLGLEAGKYEGILFNHDKAKSAFNQYNAGITAELVKSGIIFKSRPNRQSLDPKKPREIQSMAVRSMREFYAKIKAGGISVDGKPMWDPENHLELGFRIKKNPWSVINKNLHTYSDRKDVFFVTKNRWSLNPSVRIYGLSPSRIERSIQTVFKDLNAGNGKNKISDPVDPSTMKNRVDAGLSAEYEVQFPLKDRYNSLLTLHTQAGFRYGDLPTVLSTYVAVRDAEIPGQSVYGWSTYIGLKASIKPHGAVNTKLFRRKQVDVFENTYTKEFISEAAFFKQIKLHKKAIKKLLHRKTYEKIDRLQLDSEEFGKIAEGHLLYSTVTKNYQQILDIKSKLDGLEKDSEESTAKRIELVSLIRKETDKLWRLIEISITQREAELTHQDNPRDKNYLRPIFRKKTQNQDIYDGTTEEGTLR